MQSPPLNTAASSGPARYAFLNSKPPANYVAGLGRGASGFTTRSDIGPHLPDKQKSDEFEGKNEKSALEYDKQKLDEFEGNDEGLFTSAEYNEDDKEADAVWEAIEKRMDSRRKDRREAKLKEEIEKHRASNPKITEQFADLKRKLGDVSAQEWDNIPEINGDLSKKNKKNKKKRFESFVPVPDTLLEKARQENVRDLNLTAVGEGREAILSLKLDRLSDSVHGLTVVDPKGYLTDLNSMKITSSTDISDLKKGRLLLKSLTQTNPKKASGWIAAARLEEVAGKIKIARQLIKNGCEECPKDEDLWLEASRLASPHEAKVVLARGVSANPDSVKLWLRAAEMETDGMKKRAVLKLGLEKNTNSVRLWKALVELVDQEEARVLLHQAVESCPLHVELWLALARLETCEQAKKVLHQARKNFPKELAIWIATAKLQEASGNSQSVCKVIERAVESLHKAVMKIDKEAWVKEAESAEQAGSVLTCQAIIKTTIGIGVEEEDRKRTWVADAEECEKRGSIETARAIYAHALSVFLTKKSIWIKAAQLEKSHGTRESLDALLRRAVTYKPQAEVLWLMGAKEKWLAGDLPAARAVLQEAHAAIPNSEEIWLAAFKLEFENHEPERARMLLAKARERGGTERVWMKSVIVERESGNTEGERRLLQQGLKLFPKYFKLWLMLGQMEDRLGKTTDKAKQAYENGLKHCPNCIPLWLSLASLEEKTNGLSKARAILTTARKKNPQNPQLWLCAVRTESRHGNKREAETLMAKALQECPKSGLLWAESIQISPLPQRKSKSSDALKKLNNSNDPLVSAAVARLFWGERKTDKAREWFNRGVTVNSDLGDVWAWFYMFELQNGNQDTQKEVLRRCVNAEPKHGEKWQVVAKAVENSHLSVEAVLKKVVLALCKEQDDVE